MSFLLAPLSGIYAGIVWIRNWLYDEYLLPSYEVGVPTICVGNLAVGGTGKTPHVEWLLHQLAPSYKVAVLSRGYGRRTQGFMMADAESTAYTIGDEPMQIHRKFPDVPVAVCENRVRGIHLLQQRVPGLQVVILDDAFQHRRLRCGFYILLTTYDRLYVSDHYLPWGRLRDNRVQAHRANMIVVTKCPDKMQPIDRRVVENTLRLPTFQSLHFSTTVYAPLRLTQDQSCLVVTGIAHPEPLLNHVQTCCSNASLMAFPDHHVYSSRDIALIEQRAKDVDCVVTTEKDAERLALVAMSDALRAKLQVAPITVTLSDESLVRQRLFNYINN
ncbi:MAG: tetraacyldisaccharide 4'-kinase [Paludibacteraceae bacterium]|nr:tetraacyldisaccharide 4'-kinase [Paludibacteraceae bacterium]